MKMCPPKSVNPRSCRIEIAARILVLLLLLLTTLASAEGTKLSDVQRQQIIRVFLAENPFVHRAFPRGKAGIQIDDVKEKPFWTRCGSAWPHKDGKGLNVQLASGLAVTGRLVLREYTADDAAEDEKKVAKYKKK